MATRRVGPTGCGAPVERAGVFSQTPGAGQVTELTCNDGLDNDCDGQIDCLDTNRASAANCMMGVENCSDGMDNDGDLALIDCADSQCFHKVCGPTSASICSRYELHAPRRARRTAGSAAVVSVGEHLHPRRLGHAPVGHLQLPVGDEQPVSQAVGLLGADLREQPVYLQRQLLLLRQRGRGPGLEVHRRDD